MQKKLFNCLKMMIKDPVRLDGYSILPLMIKKTSFRCLDCYEEVSAKVKNALGRGETFFSFFNRT